MIVKQMILVPAFEEKLEELFQHKAMFGSTRSYRGQEAIAVGICSALQSTDLIASHYRGTGLLIAKGADPYTLRGVSAEAAALIQENLFSDFQGPVVRIAMQPIPPPHSPPLVDAMIPDVDQVVDTVMQLAEGARRS